jgi:small subunit ribosomal protein S6
LNQYEAMFLFDPTFGAAFENCEAEVRRIMDRAQAEILFCKKWDERRLAYKIQGRKRGVYVLVYFKSAPEKVGGIERDARLSENILRVLVLRADGVTPEMMEASMQIQRREAEELEREREASFDDRGGGDRRPRQRGRGGRSGAVPVEAGPDGEDLAEVT